MNTWKKFKQFILVLLTLTLPCLVEAQLTSATLNLQDSRIEVDRLAPGLTVGEAVFLIDEADQIEIDIVSTFEAITTSILAPTGELIDENSIVGLGGEFTSFAGSLPDSPFLSPASEPGFHFIYRFPSLGQGNYTVRFEADPSLSEEVAIITRLVTTSPLAVGLIATNPQVNEGDLAVLTAAVFEGGQPVADATVITTIRDSDGNLSNLTLLDDGLDADDTAGDGLYSGEFEAQIPGEYGAVAAISGLTSSGLAFVRQAAASFSVLPRRSILTGSFTDSGVDDTGNGLFDRLVISVETDTVEAGPYRLFVKLEAANGNTVVRSADADLTVGSGSIAVEFEADAILELAEDGPYEIKLFDIFLLEPNRITPADRLEDLGQTRVFLLSQFQRPGLALTGATRDEGFDDNSNGRFDRLVVEVEIDVVNAGFYNWSLKLTDQLLNEIEFSSNSGFLPSGITSLEVTFEGLPIGDSRTDGPYLLRDLLVFGAGASLVATEIGQTQPFLARQFESSNLPPVADAGPDQTIECESPSGALVNLDGTGSSDPDDDPLDFTWTGPFGEVGGPTPVVQMPLGSLIIPLTVDDGNGETDTDDVVITIEDTTPPAITANFEQLSGDDEEGRFQVSFSALDTCDPAPQVAAALHSPGCDTLPATADMVFEFELEDDECEIEFDDGIPEIEASGLTLRVTATDSFNNAATIDVPLVFESGDDDDDDDDDND